MRWIISLVLFSLAAFGSTASSGSSVSAQELAGDGQKAGTKIIVRGLKRDEGGTVTLRFQVVNDADKPHALYELVGNSLDGRAHLVDAANKKKYLVVRDSSGKCECSQIKDDVSKGNPVNLWVKFPAPPESVQKVTVVIDGFDPVESVPVAAR